MKNTITNPKALLIIFVMAANFMMAGGGKLKYDSLSCLLIEGKVLNSDENSGPCYVELIDQTNTITDTLILKDGKIKFSFVLNKNSYYSIRISKKGFISKLVAINTEILTETDGIHRFNFQTKLMNEVLLTRLNEDVVDFPVAIIHFDYEDNCFVYNKEYTSHIKRELYSVKNKQNKRSINPVLGSPVAAN